MPPLMPTTEAPIRVLHVITRMVRGGAQMNTLATVLGLDNGIWRSELATGPSEGPEGSLEIAARVAGARLIHIPDLVRPIAPARDARALGQLVRLIRRERPHVVHTHTSKAGVLGRVAARLCRAPVVVHTPHGHVFHSYESRVRTALFIGAERLCGRLADRQIALTEGCRRDHLALRIAPADRFVTIHSGVDFSPFEAARPRREAVRRELGLPPGAMVLGTVGRLAPIKGQRYLLEAFAALRQSAPRLQLLLVGDGELRADLEQLAERLGCREQTRFLGLRRDVPELLAAMDLFALPSLNEGMGRVLLEAMALELPIVATEVGGIPDLVEDGETGLLVPPGDSVALGEAIQRLLAAPELAKRLGRQGKARATPHYSQEAMVARIEALYRELLAARGIAVPGEAAGRRSASLVATAGARK